VLPLFALAMYGFTTAATGIICLMLFSACIFSLSFASADIWYQLHLSVRGDEVFISQGSFAYNHLKVQCSL
jgi:hypothetical protein